LFGRRYRVGVCLIGRDLPDSAFQMAVSDHVIIGDLPAEVDDATFKSNFEAYGTLKWFKLYPAGANGKKNAMVELGSVDEATWLVENLHGNVPLGLETEVTVKYKPAGGKGAEKGAGGGAARPGPYSGGGIAPKGGGGGCGKGAAGMMGQGQKGGGQQWNQYGFNLTDQPSTINDLWKGLLRHKVLPGGTWQNDEKTVLISGLPSDTTDHDLLKIFSPFGAIAPGGVRVTLHEDGTAKGNGMINFLDLDASKKAVETLNNCMLPDGRFLRLKNHSGEWKGKGKGKAGAGAAGPAPA